MANDLFQQLRDKLDAEKKHFGGPSGKGGSVVMGSTTGPASFRLVEMLLEITEAQEKRIAALEAKAKG